MAEGNAYRHHLLDPVTLLRESLTEARKEMDGLPVGSDRAPFEEGRVFAYAEVLSTMFHEANALEIPLAVIGLDRFDPARELAK